MLEVKFFKDGEEYKPTPIEVANMLMALLNQAITKTLDENESTNIEVDYFDVYDLKEIADHIQARISRLDIQYAIAESEGESR